MPFSILIVDDTRVSRMMLKKCLPEGDYKISEASGGQEGLNLYKKEKHDLVFLDLTMPEMTGFETLEHLKKIDPDVRVIIATADVQTGATEKVMKLGALEVIHKPFNQKIITEIIKRFKK